MERQPTAWQQQLFEISLYVVVWTVDCCCKTFPDHFAFEYTHNALLDVSPTANPLNPLLCLSTDEDETRTRAIAVSFMLEPRLFRKVTSNWSTPRCIQIAKHTLLQHYICTSTDPATSSQSSVSLSRNPSVIKPRASP